MPPLYTDKKPRVLAFHLPQFHPIPENDEWWGQGFTEWTNVVKGRPLFDGHYQPRLPSEQGFYDLRLPEARALQAHLARIAGIDGFIYYHYWFNGRRLLERPVTEILRSKQPDFPFCLCWANEPWSRNWDGQGHKVIMPQTYSEDDDKNHINALLPAFSDARYIKFNGCPLLLVYRPSSLPDVRHTASLWREAAARYGFPGLVLAAVRAFPGEFRNAADFGMDFSVEFKPNGTECGPTLQSDNPLDIGHRLHRIWRYDDMVRVSLQTPIPDYPFFPGVCPSWDNSVRRKEGAAIFIDSTPEKYGAWLTEVLVRERLRPQAESIVAINAWNEWAEGNHLEPCHRWGRAYMEATRNAIDSADVLAASLASFQFGQIVRNTPGFSLRGNVDCIKSSADGLHFDGWSLDNESLRPPDLMVFATRNPDDSFTLHQRLERQRLPRPDVATAVGTPHSLPCGWRGTWQPKAGSSAVALLAIRARDQAIASVHELT